MHFDSVFFQTLNQLLFNLQIRTTIFNKRLFVFLSLKVNFSCEKYNCVEKKFVGEKLQK